MNYDKLWKLRIDKKMNKIQLNRQAHVPTNTITIIGRDGDVSIKVFDKIFEY